jgi:hypothetical protein
MYPHPFNIDVNLARAFDTVGLTDEGDLSALGQEGIIEYVSIRETAAPANEATALDLYVVDGLADATPFVVATCPENACAYISRAVAVAGASAVLDDDQDNVADRGGAYYKLKNLATFLRLVADITAAAGGGGTTELTVTLRGQVWS